MTVTMQGDSLQNLEPLTNNPNTEDAAEQEALKAAVSVLAKFFGDRPLQIIATAGSADPEQLSDTLTVAVHALPSE